MAVDKVGQKNVQPNTIKGSVKDFDKKMEQISNQYIDPPKTKADLEHNANLKKQQIALAQKNGDVNMAQTLTAELNKINKDIAKNEAMNSSVFDQKNDKA